MNNDNIVIINKMNEIEKENPMSPCNYNIINPGKIYMTIWVIIPWI